jgi:arylsulfatase A-like enzyme
MARLPIGTPALAFVLLACSGGESAGASLPPDVLIVLADDLDWAELDASPTPSLDELAREGVTLRQFIGMPVCSVARHALLHGRWPRRSGVGGNVNSHAPPSAANPTPSAELVSLPKLLKARGYHTALVGKWHLGQASAEGGADPLLSAPRAHGFDHWLAGTPANLLAREGKGYDEWVRVDDGVQRIEHEYATRAMRDAALAWWQATPSPRFLLVALCAPHPPMHLAPADLVPDGFHVVEGQRNQLHSMIGTVDHVVGALRAAADPARTLFLFLADNGVGPAIDDAHESKGTTAERGILVPFVAAGPGLARGAECGEPVSIVDVLATVAEATGTEVARGGPGAEDSRSFLGALASPASWRAPRPWVLAERYDARADDFALRTARWKLRRLDGEESLLDLVHDPGEARPMRAGGERDAGLEGEARAALAELRRILADEVPQRAN